ncbi:MAG: DUF1189 family protein [Wujia sp.]
MRLSEQIVYGMFKPSKYKEMLTLPTRKFVTYVIIMMLVLGIVGFDVPAASIISGFGGFEKLFSQSLGQVSYKDGTLSVSNDFNMHINYANFIVDTTQETVQNQSLKKEGMFFAVGSKTIRVSAVIGSKVTDYGIYYLSDYLPEGFNNDSLLALIPSIYAGFFLTLIGVMCSYFLKYGLISLLLSVLVNSMNKQFELNLRFGQVFALCFYAQSFGMLLSNFNLAVSLLPSMLVSMIGIFVTIHMLTTSVVLMKQEREN